MARENVYKHTKIILVAFILTMASLLGGGYINE